jgi:hypothetical protein
MEKKEEDMKKEKTYLSGAISGQSGYNIHLFDKVAAKLREQDKIVFSPVENDKRMGIELKDCVMKNGVPGKSRRQVLKSDCVWICDHAEKIVVLPGWENLCFPGSSRQGIKGELGSGKNRLDSIGINDGWGSSGIAFQP